MWRAFFIALGISLCILGAECLILDKAVMKREQKAIPAEAGSTYLSQSAASTNNRELKPKDWHPWSLLSTGAVIILYSFSLPRRNG